MLIRKKNTSFSFFLVLKKIKNFISFFADDVKRYNTIDDIESDMMAFGKTIINDFVDIKPLENRTD